MKIIYYVKHGFGWTSKLVFTATDDLGYYLDHCSDCEWIIPGTMR